MIPYVTREPTGGQADATEADARDLKPGQYKADQLGLAIGYRRAAIHLRSALDGEPQP